MSRVRGSVADGKMNSRHPAPPPSPTKRGLAKAAFVRPHQEPRSGRVTLRVRIIVNSHTRKGYGQQADMWSLGVILYILISGYPPFHDDNHNALFLKIAKGTTC